MLTKDQRIAISRKIVVIPKQNAILDETAATLSDELAKAQSEDDANKNLLDGNNAVVTPYQNELSRYDGNGRSNISEQNILDSAKRVLGNFFFPNNAQVPTPSLPQGIWKNLIPYARNIAVGKNYQETYESVTKEGMLITQAMALIAQIQAYSEIIRSTGQSCGSSGVCSLPQYVTQISCEANSGVWTESGDVISNNQLVQDLNTQIKSKTIELRSFLNSTRSIIANNTDSNAARAAANNATVALLSIQITSLDTWIALPDFDPSTSQTTCAGFNVYNPYLLNQSKYRNDSIIQLNAIFTARTSQVTSRMGDVSSYLGTVTQNLDTGAITAYQGLYGDRFRLIQMRINILAGSLSKVLNIANGVNAQDEFKAANENALAVYDTLMISKIFSTPAGGHSKISLVDATGITINQSGYIISDTQEEIAVTVISIEGNTVEVSARIPLKYRETENARYYSLI